MVAKAKATEEDWAHMLETFGKLDSSTRALIGLASDIELARTVLAESDSRSYQLIWRTSKSRFYITIKTAPIPTNLQAPRDQSKRPRQSASDDEAWLRRS
jgi:hypothetical protein